MIQLPPTRYLLPNLFTLSATFCGFAAIWLATQATSGEQFYGAAALICLAVFLDGLDGRIARWVDAQSKFGGELDSLSDFLTFGVAPATLVYAWGLQPMGVAGLVIAFLFAAAAMIRLARYNVESHESPGVARYFTGLPAPMAGMGVSLLVGINSGVLGRDVVTASARPSLAIFLVLVGLLMVSTVPFRTFKDLHQSWTNRLLIAAILAVQVVVSVTVDFMVALALGLIGYLAVNITGGVVGVARAVRVRPSRGAASIEDIDDTDG